MGTDQEKRLAGIAAAEQIEDGMAVGLGTGSTVFWTIQRLGELVADGLNIRCIPTSEQTAALAASLGIPLTSFADMTELDLTIDGADEVDVNVNLIKGGGGALLREKIVALASKHYVIVVDSSKRVERLGAFPVPVEVSPFGFEVTQLRLQSCGCTAMLRMQDGNPFITDNGNYIMDCAFGRIDDAAALHSRLKHLTGVVETGLFVDMQKTIIVGIDDGVEVISG